MKHKKCKHTKACWETADDYWEEKKTSSSLTATTKWNFAPVWHTSIYSGHHEWLAVMPLEQNSPKPTGVLTQFLPQCNMHIYKYIYIFLFISHIMTPSTLNEKEFQKQALTTMEKSLWGTGNTERVPVVMVLTSLHNFFNPNHIL